VRQRCYPTQDSTVGHDVVEHEKAVARVVLAKL
jgi:hypothetical protein